MNQQQKTFRRIVTGHDADHQVIIVSDAPPSTYTIDWWSGWPYLL